MIYFFLIQKVSCEAWMAIINLLVALVCGDSFEYIAYLSLQAVYNLLISIAICYEKQ